MQFSKGFTLFNNTSRLKGTRERNGFELAGFEPSLSTRKLITLSMMPRRLGLITIISCCRTFLMSKQLISDLRQRTSDPGVARYLKWKPKMFSVDAGYDLAFAIKSDYMLRFRPQMTHEASFYAKKSSECSTFSVSGNRATSNVSTRKILNETLFAVKTCKKFHSARLKIIQETWAPFVQNLIIVSEFQDPAYGTITLPGK